MTLGTRIRSIRKEKGLSILDLKNITGLSKSTISEIENDKSSPTAETLSKIATGLGVTVDEFFKPDPIANERSKKSNNAYNNKVEETNVAYDIENINVPNEYSSKYKVTSRDKEQYKEFIKKETQAFFMNDEFDEEDKKEILDVMNEIFWEAKALNKRKHKK
jgi:transcriptional regulator with XRE-family HTH domain